MLCLYRMTELNVVLECSHLPWKKRSDFKAREQNVFEITPADLRHVTFCPYICTLARLQKREMDEYKNDERRELSDWFGVERGRKIL